ncbi:MAG TPA: molybdopterin-binding protein [Methanospirillum sp.]|nr:molybdopterin-binding protein [Methanospirillum sp.]
MKRYLSQIPLHQAISLLTSTFSSPARCEKIPVELATGRIAIDPIYAPETIPRVRTATMDGIAVKSGDTGSAQDRHPCGLNDASLICTGQEVPGEYDAVVPSEEVVHEGPGQYQVRRPARQGQNMRLPGEEVKQGRLILKPGHRITPSDIGALLTYGISVIHVRSLIVGLIPTGDELIAGGESVTADQVRESNTAVIGALLMQAGICPIRYGIVPDDPEKITEAIRTAVEACDLVVVIAGSSAGSRDHTRETIEEIGSILFHGIAIRPGRTMLCGTVENTPVIGLPGQPVAALTAWREVVSPFLQYWGYIWPEQRECIARTGEPITSDGGIDEFIPVSVVSISGENIVFPRPRGSAGQMHAIRSNAILHIPAIKEGYQEGAMVMVRLTREYEPGREILIAGISDALTDHLEVTFTCREHRVQVRSMSAMGAAALLCKGRCHAIMLMWSSLCRDGSILSLLRTGCQDPVVSVGIGSMDGDQMMLVFRDNGTTRDEITALKQFLASDIWKESGGLPQGYSTDGAGMCRDLLEPDSPGEKAPLPKAEKPEGVLS